MVATPDNASTPGLLTMRFAFTIVYVQDVPRTLQFYQAAFGLQTSMLHPSQEYGELETGATKLAFATHALAKTSLPGGYHAVDHADPKPLGIEIALMTDNVAEALEQALAAGGTLVADTVVKPWGQTVAYLRDPEGTLIELCSPINS